MRRRTREREKWIFGRLVFRGDVGARASAGGWAACWLQASSSRWRSSSSSAALRTRPVHYYVLAIYWRKRWSLIIRVAD